MDDRVPLSGYWLKSDGWVQVGATYTKGVDTIEYDGVWWRYYPIPECLRFTNEDGVIHEARIIEFTDQLIR